MNKNYNLSHRIIACVLLISFFLQSCNNFSNPIISKEKEAANNTLGSSKKSISNHLVCKTFTAEKGDLVTFHEQDGQLQADVTISGTENSKKPTVYRNLPIYVAEDMDLSSINKLGEKDEKRYIQANLSKDNQPRHVYVGSREIKGGMKRGKEKEKEKETETETKDREGNKASQAEYKIKELQDFIEVATNNAEKAKGKDIVLVLGDTGAGKSTIINYLLGSEMKRQKVRRKTIAIPKHEEKEWAKMGHGLTSETFLPSVYESSDSPFIYCDCPGFNDTHKDEDRLNTTIATQLIINCAERIRGIIAVIDVAALDNSRAEGMRQLSVTLSKLFKEDIDPNSILFIFNDKKLDTELDLDEALAYIHEDIKKLKESTESKLEDIYKQIETGKADNKEHKKTYQTLATLNRISTNKNNTCIIDLFDNFESKAQIEMLLTKLQTTPKEYFSFSEYDYTRVKSNSQLTKIITDLSNKMIDLMHTTENIRINNERIESCEERIEFLKLEIDLLHSDKTMNNEDRIPSLQQQMRKNNQRLEELKINQIGSQEKFNELMKEKTTLNTDDYTKYSNLYHSCAVSSNPKQYSTHRRYIVEYKDIPFDNHSLTITRFDKLNKDARNSYSFKDIKSISTDKDSGIQTIDFGDTKISHYLPVQKEYLTEHINDKEEGIYKATYRPPVLPSTSSENLVSSFYVKKKNIPANKARIEQIHKELVQQQKLIEEYNQQIEVMKPACKAIEDLIAYYTADVASQRKQITNRKRYLEEELARIKREKSDAESNNKEQQRIKEGAERYLAEREQVLAGVNTLISHGIGGESSLAEKFKEYYQHYSALLEQGSDYLLYLPEKELPTFLFCSLRCDILVDPVITACGHTFSQQNLLEWLNREKTCPTCRQTVSEIELKPNLNIRQAIQEFEKKKDN